MVSQHDKKHSLNNNESANGKHILAYPPGLIPEGQRVAVTKENVLGRALCAGNSTTCIKKCMDARPVLYLIVREKGKFLEDGTFWDQQRDWVG